MLELLKICINAWCCGFIACVMVTKKFDEG